MKARQGFTIVELLIVIVVIAILAAITIMAYNGIQNRAKAAAVQVAVSQTVKKLQLYSAENAGQLPDKLSTIGIQSTADTTYQYMPDGSSYCMTVTKDDISYNASDSRQTVSSGICPTNSIIVWNKFDARTKPLSGSDVILDSSAGNFRSSAPGMRLAPGVIAEFRGSPFAVSGGQQYKVSFWMKSDSDWNGVANNSKIRFAQGDGTFITACAYNGVKLTWTYVDCTYTVPSTLTQLAVRVMNDGSTGNIWIDDFVFAKLN